MKPSYEGMVTVDGQQCVVGINGAAQQMFGRTAAELLGAPLSSLIPERLRPDHERQLRQFVDLGELGSSQQHVMGQGRLVMGLRASGEEFPIEVVVYRSDVATPGGPSQLYTALVHDLSQTHPERPDLEAATRRLRAVFDLAPVAIWITEKEQIVFANPACAALFGASSPESLVRRHLFDLLSEESSAEVREKMARVLNADTPVAVLNERIARLDGTQHEVEIAIAALPEHGQGVLQMVITDRTLKQRERRAAERTRRSLQRIAHLQSQAREDERQRIARELHDDLGQRLVALKIELSLLEDQAGADRMLADRLAIALNMVDSLVTEVRRLATDLRPLQFDMLGLNKAIEALTQGIARRLPLHIRLQLQDVDWPHKHPAPIAVYRMVQEALTNVIRHAGATQVEIETRLQDQRFVLVIQDNGVGFGKRQIAGRSSLGLVGMRERAQMLGGSLVLSNSPGRGARIEVQLPMEQLPERRQPDADLSTAALAHELQVHQIELENQNEELRRTQLALAAARDRYADLYDFAPVAYVTLNAQGRFLGLNQTAARMFGLSRADLLNMTFERFVASSDGPRWRQEFANALVSEYATRIDITLRPESGMLLSVQVDCRRVAPTPEAEPTLRMTLADVSHLKLAAMDRRIAASAVAAREGDRRRVAFQLHEDLGQQLCALKMNLAEFEVRNEAGLAPGRIGEMMATLDASLDSVRSMASELRPLLLDNLGLMAALEWLGHDQSRRSGVEITLSMDDEDPPLDEPGSVALYRLIEQLLAHGVRGASQGRRLSLSLHRQAEVLILHLQRDASGWPQTNTAIERGELEQMARTVGGQVDMDDTTASGWAVTVRIPVRPAAGLSLLPAPDVPVELVSGLSAAPASPAAGH